jgi:organic hydroperoxide reductase OsmC/OhrA
MEVDEGVMTNDHEYHVSLTLARGYEFVAEFPDVIGSAAMLLDEPQPLGGSRGPNAAAVLGAAIGNCLAASLSFCLHKARATVDGMTANVTTHVSRNEAGKLRISGVDVELTPNIVGDDGAKLDRCEPLFQDFCMVTESVKRGIPVHVVVKKLQPTAV